MDTFNSNSFYLSRMLQKSYFIENTNKRYHFWSIIEDSSFEIRVVVSALRNDYYLPPLWSFERKTYTWSSRKSSHSWNPADFIWISWNPADFRWNPADSIWISGEICWILYGFHTWNLLDFTPEIHQISGEIHRISKGQLPGMVSPMFMKLHHHT